MRGGEVLYESLLGLSADGSPGHTTRLLEEVERAAEAAGGWSAVERIAVGVGPGSFTGLRVGIASARALGASTGLPLAGVGTLDALAHGLAAAAGGRGRGCT
jgi:tRNA threonylcarbamoyl adenosine modification protein YeaZ